MENAPTNKGWPIGPPEVILKRANIFPSPRDPTLGHPWSVAGDMPMLPGGISIKWGWNKVEINLVGVDLTEISHKGTKLTHSFV